MKYQIPKILLYSRFVFTLIVISLSFTESVWNNDIVILLMYTGIITDVFDGIIARKLGISTDSFRVQDTVIDLFFYLSILGYITLSSTQVISDNIIPITVILSLELLMYLISLIRFRKLPSPHAILSKFWGIYIVIEFTLLLLQVKGIHFSIALYIGVFVHLDRVFIYSILREWNHDIPSSYHTLLIRDGKKIKRNKLFNG